ncbi:MAG: hemerythrin family protein [Nautiliaceae bacterium]|jgi:hemerythrin
MFEISLVAFEPMNEIHQREITYLKNLLEAIEKNLDVNKAFEEFLKDVKEHFAFEENLMQKYNFFAYIPHKTEHDRILNELKNLNTEDKEELKKYLIKTFIPWLHNHINTIDTVTAGFFKMINATN